MTSTKPFFQSDKPLNFGHRGFAGQYPENTILSYQKAIEAGSDVLEMDVQLTSDNKLIVFHDDTLDRMTSGIGKVQEKSLIEIKKVNVGSNFILQENGKNSCPFKNSELKVPLLSEVFNEFKQYRFNIDIKQHEKKVCEALFETIKEFKFKEKVLVASDDYETIKYFRSLSKEEIATGASYREVANFIFYKSINMLKRFHIEADAFQIPEKYFEIRILTENLIIEAHKKNIAVHPWTINEKADMERLLRWGVDGIMTDFPDRLDEILNTPANTHSQK